MGGPRAGPGRRAPAPGRCPRAGRRPRAAAAQPAPARWPPRSNARRPAGAPRGRGGRRVLAVLALALIAGALYLINATFQPFHDDPSGAVRVTVPQRLRRRPDRRDPGGGRRDRLRAAVRGQRDGHDAARQAAPRQVPAAARDEQRRGDRGADAGPAGEGRQDLHLHAPRGPLAAREHPARQQGVQRRLREGDQDPRPARRARRSGCRATRARSRASCSPRPTR